MTASVIGSTATSPLGLRQPGFLQTTAGKKAIMAVSGLALFGFVVAHLLGNLQIFLGAAQFNGYAAALRHLPVLLWTARVGLLVMVSLHIWSAVQLARIRGYARPLRYSKQRSTGSSYASRTMYWSGPILGAFIVYHLLQLTFGAGGTPYQPADAYGNVVAGFRVLPVAGFYVFAMAMLSLHLRHGIWSTLQTLGYHHPRYSPLLRKVAAGMAILVFAGFSSIPVAVLAGLLREAR